ncbi:MAG: antibiotic biosynthesis monooxygenase, partial [Cryomorphaceae bacterium]|nr:antibiotic biosynthesis monooxygenase [Cryomorphaceae bacterium]
EGYAELDEETLQLVGDVPGYVGYESVKNAKGRSIFISYWQSMEAVNQWRAKARHKVAKSHGKQWYAAYHSMLVKIEYSAEYNTQIL